MLAPLPVLPHREQRCNPHSGQTPLGTGDIIAEAMKYLDHIILKNSAKALFPSLLEIRDWKA